jgi:hypothetical protein
MQTLRLDRFATLSLFQPLRRRIARGAGRIPILMYHSISETQNAGAHPYYQTTTAPKVFAEHMQFLRENNYHVIGLGDAVKEIEGPARGSAKCVVMTFDDGFGDFYTQAFPLLNHYGFSATVFLPTAYIGFPGSLVSPSRGLLVYTPWAAFAFWGAARLWREKSLGWSRPLIVALVAIWAVQVGAQDYWAGWCFGPRYFTDLLPFLAWFLVPVWASIRARPVLRVAFAATVAFALWVQVVGTFYYPQGDWDGSPVDVELKPQRCWDWSDNQLRRSWEAGPAPLVLLSEWERVLQGRSEEPQP